MHMDGVWLSARNNITVAYAYIYIVRINGMQCIGWDVAGYGKEHSQLARTVCVAESGLTKFVEIDRSWKSLWA